MGVKRSIKDVARHDACHKIWSTAYLYTFLRKNMITGGKLLLPCEVGVKTVLPAIRALMARTFIEKHRMQETQVAEILGLSQSAISRYTTKDRGNIIVIEDEPEVQKLIDQMTNFLIYEPHKKAELFKLFCATCEIIRKKGLMCQFCQKKMHKKWLETCEFCRSIQSKKIIEEI